MACEKYMKLKFQGALIKLYWNTAMSNSFTYWLWLFFALMAELNSLDKDHVAHKAQDLYYLALYRTFCQPRVYIMSCVCNCSFTWSCRIALWVIPQFTYPLCLWAFGKFPGGGRALP